MENSAKFYSGLAIMAGLIFLGAMLPTAVKTNKSFDRTVSVRGLCEKEVAADKVIWPITYRVGGNELQAVLGDIDRSNKVIIDFLKKGGIEDTEISVSVPEISDRDTQEYGDRDRRNRYLVTNVITVSTPKVDKVLALMASQNELVKDGIVFYTSYDTGTPNFFFEGLNEIKPGMVEEATRNAREVAKKFAEDSGSRLGKIKTASQGVFSIDNRDANTPEIKKVRVVTAVTYYLKK